MNPDIDSPRPPQKNSPSCPDFRSGSPRSLYPSPRPPTSLSAGLGPALPSRRPPWTVGGTPGPARSPDQNCRGPPTTWPDLAGRDRRLQIRAVPISKAQRAWASPPASGSSLRHLHEEFRRPPRGSCLRRRLRPAADCELQAGPAPAGPALGPGQRAPPPATSRLGQQGGRRALTGNVAAALLSAASLSEYSFEKSCWVWLRPAPPPPPASLGLLPSSGLSSSGAASLTASMLPVWRGYWLISVSSKRLVHVPAVFRPWQGTEQTDSVPGMKDK